MSSPDVGAIDSFLIERFLKGTVNLRAQENIRTRISSPIFQEGKKLKALLHWNGLSIYTFPESNETQNQFESIWIQILNRFMLFHELWIGSFSYISMIRFHAFPWIWKVPSSRTSRTTFFKLYVPQLRSRGQKLQWFCLKSSKLFKKLVFCKPGSQLLITILIGDQT